jgi:hypothetical protein
MVHTSSAVAFATVAFGAASSFAVPVILNTQQQQPQRYEPHPSATKKWVSGALSSAYGAAPQRGKARKYVLRLTSDPNPLTFWRRHVHKGKKILKYVNEYGPNVLEHGLPIAGDFIPNTQPQPQNQNQTQPQPQQPGQQQQQQQPPQMREYDDMELFEHNLDELESREPYSSAVEKWIKAAINGGFDFASNAIQSSGVGHRRGLE